MRAFALLLIVLTACSGGPAGDARFQADAARLEGRASSPPGESAPARSGDVPLPKNLPPAAMFLQSGSHRTTPSRYCLEDECAVLKPPPPPALEGPSESPVLFTLSAAPLRARLEVTASGAAPQIVALTPGSSMAWQPIMKPGAYRLTLTAIYATTEVSWPFAMTIVDGNRR